MLAFRILSETFQNAKEKVHGFERVSVNRSVPDQRTVHFLLSDCTERRREIGMFQNSGCAFMGFAHECSCDHARVVACRKD